MKLKKSFTLIEILIIIVIITIFSGLSFAYYNNFTQQLKLKKEAIRLNNVIDLARKKAFSSDIYDSNCPNFQGYKVSISANAYSLIFICDNLKVLQTYNLENNLSIITGTGEMIFPILGRNINININTVTIKNNNQCLDLNIDTLGNVNIGNIYNCP